MTFPSANVSKDTCPDCGALVAGGRAGCRALFDQMVARAYNDPLYAAVRDLALDAYCMQHLETFCRSAKSYAAHLTRLCCGLEYGGDPAVYAAIQRWLNGPAPIEKPGTLSSLGQITLVDVQAAGTPFPTPHRGVGGALGTGEEHVRLARAWAANVWEAYAEQHDLARAWIRAAVGKDAA